MGSHVDQIQARLLKKDAQGNPLSLIAGQESLEELRKLIIEFSQACPAKQKHLQCPFFIMSSLSYGSLTNVVNNLPRAACLDLFQMELDCRTQAMAPCISEGQKNLP